MAPEIGEQNGVIGVRGANVNNLREFSCEIPRHRLVAISGLSGSGKSTLLFSLLGAESRRRLAALQGASFHREPRRGVITGLPLSSELASNSPRFRSQTVATQGDLFDDLLSWALQVGQPGCVRCGKVIENYTRQRLLREAATWNEGEEVTLLLPLERSSVGFSKDLELALTLGVTRVRIAEDFTPLEESIGALRELDRCELVIDRFRLRVGDLSRLSEALHRGSDLATKFEHSRGEMTVVRSVAQVDYRIFFECTCEHCGMTQREISPALFAFTTNVGSCNTCHGSGSMLEFPTRSAMKQSAKGKKPPASISGDLSPCSECAGARISAEARAFIVDDVSFGALLLLPLEGLRLRFDTLFRANEFGVRLKTKLDALLRVDLGYLSLSRGVRNLSSGEFDRLRLIAALEGEESGLCYLLDEPTAGLHPQNIRDVVNVLRSIVENSNTVIFSEHRREALSQADYLLELGPGRGREGGQLVVAGSIEEISPGTSRLATILKTGFVQRASDHSRSDILNSPHLVFTQLTRNNISDLSCSIPLGGLTVIAGVSGSGKSTLLFDLIVPRLQERLLARRRRQPMPDEAGRSVIGDELIHRVVSPRISPFVSRGRLFTVGQMSGLLPLIIEFFAQSVDAKISGLSARDFSPSSARSRCAHCRGSGMEERGSDDEPRLCPVCEGARIVGPASRVRVYGLTLSEVLRQSISECGQTFSRLPNIRDLCARLESNGLGYLCLGQAVTSLSLGELRRIRLTRALQNQIEGGTFFAFDEPMRSLHPEEGILMLEQFSRITQSGNTVVVVEHNLEIITAADFLIELGPGGGSHGGKIVFAGSPSEAAASSQSIIGRYL